VQRGRDRVRCQLERNEKFLSQDFTGMNQRKLLAMADLPRCGGWEATPEV
jgi:hypothetical protein